MKKKRVKKVNKALKNWVVSDIHTTSTSVNYNYTITCNGRN